MRRHFWAISTAGSLGALGLGVTSGLVVLANHFVEQLSQPHQLANEDDFTWIIPRLESEPPSEQRRSLLLHTADGKLLRGEFWAQSHPAPTVIICHGYRLSRAYLKPVAALDHKLGYNVLLFDFRGHGDSESVATSGGNAEVRDLEAAITAARQQPETLPGKIILYGFSMGAAIALLTPPHPDVVAIVVDSPYARLDDMLRRFVHWHLIHGSSSWRPFLQHLRSTFPAIAWCTVAVSTLVFRLRFGHALIARPDASFKRWKAKANALLPASPPPILLIHGMEDKLVPFTHARQIAAAAQAANIPIETYFVEHASHCGAYGKDPQQYITVLQDFAARYLGEDFPHGSE